MPWYAATHDGSLTHAYGVRTGAKAFCSWQLDPQGLTLSADVRSGGAGVQLGERILDVCDVVCRAGRSGESAFTAIHAFCRALCANPRLPPQPVYGSNDWYWVYGKNSADTVRADAQHIVELSPSGENRPFAVIDDGWQPVRGKDKAGVGTWDRGNEKFPDMPGLAADIRRSGARPGVWIRPLHARGGAPRCAECQPRIQACQVTSRCHDPMCRRLPCPSPAPVATHRRPPRTAGSRPPGSVGWRVGQPP